MNHYREIESKALDLLCPACGTCTISVFLRCDSGDRECHAIASCQNCGKQFDAEILPTFLECFEALRRTAERELCPACAARRQVVRSLCDRVARRCFFLVACCACGRVRPA